MACANCGQTIRPTSRARYCMELECQRAGGRAYDRERRDKAGKLARSKAARRITRAPSRSPIKQEDTSLPPIGVVVDDGERVQCHVCGRWYGRLLTHALRTHELLPDDYREAFGIARGKSLVGPATALKMRQAALDRDQGSVGRANIAPTAGRPTGIANRLSSRIQSSRNAARRAAQ